MSNYQFVPVTEIPKLYNKTKNLEILKSFLDSGMEMCELRLDTPKKNPAGYLRASAARFSLPVDVIGRHGKGYLVRRKP